MTLKINFDHTPGFPANAGVGNSYDVNLRKKEGRPAKALMREHWTKDKAE